MAASKQISALPPRPVVDLSVLPPIQDGDRLDQPTFHARYEAMPASFRAELIEGVVHVPSPFKRPHGKMHIKLCHWLSEYQEATPGTDGFDNASTILGPDAEPQPDLSLLVSGKMGQTQDKDNYIVGPPELVVEVAWSTEEIDLHGKKRDYERSGVREYIVVALREEKVYWFAACDGKFVPIQAGGDGILRSEFFPGLWLDPHALLQQDMQRVLAVLRQGLATADHAAFVTGLAATPAKPSPKQ